MLKIALQTLVEKQIEVMGQAAEKLGGSWAGIKRTRKELEVLQGRCLSAKRRK